MCSRKWPSESRKTPTTESRFGSPRPLEMAKTDGTMPGSMVSSARMYGAALRRCEEGVSASIGRLTSRREVGLTWSSLYRHALPTTSSASSLSMFRAHSVACGTKCSLTVFCKIRVRIAFHSSAIVEEKSER